MSKTERWNTIERIFYCALEQAPERRSAFLDSACHGDVQLRRLIEALLQQDNSSYSFMTRPAAELFPITLFPGTRLGPYQVVGVAGIGGMGQVYRATDSRLKRDVAIKTLPLSPSFSLDAERLERFEREATILASVNHPNIGSIYDVIEGADARFLVLEFVEGLTLNQHLDKGPLPIKDVLPIALQIAKALEASHEKGIVHRDLKPANIKITPTGHVKVLDFGLAEAFGSEPGNAPNAPSEIFVAAVAKLTSIRGTPAYMSPEQVRGDSLDPRTDIWAFGCVLYELLTSTRAFDAKTISSTLDAILNSEPDWNRVPQDVPLDLQMLLRRCFNKDPGDRFPSAKELRQQIEKMLAPVPIRSSRAGLVVAFGIVVIGLIALIVFVTRNDSGSPHVEQTRQVTFGPELVVDPAFSPDGEMVAYSILAGDRTDIYVRQLASGDVINLTRDIPGSVHRWPRWSPDGALIAFVTRPDDVLATSWFNRHAIQVMPASGGTARRIGSGGRLGHTWSPDGMRLAFVRDYGIYIASLDGREPVLIGEISQVHSLAWSPDSNWIAYVSGNPEYVFSPSELGNIAASSVGVIPAAGGVPHVLTDKVTSNSSPAWAADSKSILFLSNRGGSRDVFQLKLSNVGTAMGEPVRLTTGLNALTIDLSRDGKQLVYVTFARKGNLWAMPIPQQGSASVSSAERLTSGSQIIEGVDASLDGQFLAFDSNLGGNQDIYRMPRNGGQAQQLTTDPRDDFMPSWSPDGKFIAFHSFRTGNRDIFIMAADGQNQQQVTNDPAQERYAAWSPDGRSLVFFSDKTGRPEVYVITKEKNAWVKPRQLTSSRGSQFPRWSPDGKLIAYIDLTEGLKVIAPSGENLKLLVSRRAGFFPIYTRWSTNSHDIYFKVNDDQDVGSIWSIPSTGGVPRRLVQFQQADRVEFGVNGNEFFFPITERDTEMWVAKLAR